MSAMTLISPASANFDEAARPVPARRAPSYADRLRRYWRSPKGLLTLVFLPLLFVAGRAAGWERALPHVAIAVVGACVIDLMVIRVTFKTWFWPTGALLSGMIVAFVLGPETPWLVTLAVGGFAAASKHIFVFRRVQVFNPAALALLVAIPLFRIDQSWWGALADLPWLWVVLLLALGTVVVERINKFPLVLAFTGTYFALFTVAAFGSAGGLADAAQVSEQFRAPFVHAALFLACFMLTDPPTSPVREAEQVWVGAIAAAAAVTAQLLGAGQSYLLLGLLAGNVLLAARRLSPA